MTGTKGRGRPGYAYTGKSSRWVKSKKIGMLKVECGKKAEPDQGKRSKKKKKRKIPLGREGRQFAFFSEEKTGRKKRWKKRIEKKPTREAASHEDFTILFAGRERRWSNSTRRRKRQKGPREKKRFLWIPSSGEEKV